MRGVLLCSYAQVDLKPQWKGPIREKWLQDPVLKGAIDSLGGLTEVTQEQVCRILDRFSLAHKSC